MEQRRVVGPIRYEAARFCHVCVELHCWQSTRQRQLGDPSSLVEKHGINLADNAVRAVVSDGGKDALKISRSPHLERLKAQVERNGPGPELVDRLTRDF